MLSTYILAIFFIILQMILACKTASLLQLSFKDIQWNILGKFGSFLRGLIIFRRLCIIKRIIYSTLPRIFCSWQTHLDAKLLWMTYELFYFITFKDINYCYRLNILVRYYVIFNNSIRIIRVKNGGIIIDFLLDLCLK